MTTDVRLLSTYKGFPPQSIISLPDAEATSLVSVNNATLTLTGGTRRYQDLAPLTNAAVYAPKGTQNVQQNQRFGVTVPEGYVLTTVVNSGAGTLQAIDANGAAIGSPVALSGTATQSNAAGTRRYVIACTAGSIDASVGDAVLQMKPYLNATNSVLLVGDSMCERSFSQASASGSPVDNGDGTATMTFGSSPFVQAIQTAVGDTIRVNNASVSKLNQLAATVTAVDTTAKTVTYTTTGAYSPMVGSGTPFIVLERSLSPLAFFPYLNQLAGGELVVTSNCSQGGAALAEVSIIFDAITCA